ncbi:MAG: hypothetical protein A2591_03630 [Candidatus Yonathbacteria bacterium RIFOXYD1_FULL_52_36]|uniref:Uncharacterized protein n=1 Tax=Candidatus Yonathbacteria bacterium RIFOXYD1_FULL_52_36 TaxID=1802730 RepID=A0A1G2SM51_9BACT|nr:MAG: hypothetical protein A2591_03630 [Candidatus Yonathbacteria bacterium RIFOXYD1_FULL_52_36]
MSIQETLEEMHPLKQGRRYDGYFSCIRAALAAYRMYGAQEDTLPMAKEMLQGYVDRVAHALHLIELRYLFDASATVDIDAQYSGFPGSYHFGVLEHDLEHGPHDGTLNQRDLRKVVLDTLFKQGAASEHLLHDLALRQYFDELHGAAQPFLPFEVVRLQAPAEGSTEYVIAWISFDGVKNLPCVYTMFFEYSGAEAFHRESTYMRKVAKVLSEETNAMPLMSDLAHTIDSALIDIHPKYIHRITIGPVFIPGLTCENDGILELLENQPEHHRGAFSFAMQITHEDIQSSGQHETGAVAKELGIDRRFEVFQVNDLDERCAERKATRVRQILLVPHRIAQSISSEDAKHLNHDIVTFDNNGGLL